MRIALAAALVLALPAAAADLGALRWEKRPILVFAPSADDPRLAEQLARFEAAEAALAERRNTVIVDTEPGSALRRRFDPAGFTVILVGLDGGEKFRRDGIVAVETLNARIDAMPMRRRELRRERPGAECCATHGGCVYPDHDLTGASDG